MQQTLLMPFLYRSILLFFVLGSIKSTLYAQDSTELSSVDIPPLFQGCADPLVSQVQRQACSAPKLQKFIREHLLYPDSARKNGVEGVVVVRFSVSKEGDITDLELLRNIGSGCGQEALRVVRMMPRFTPAYRNGEAIGTQMTLPIRFSKKAHKHQYRVEWGATYTNKITKVELKKLLNRQLIVRDVYGETYHPHLILLTIETPNKEFKYTSRSQQLSSEMVKALKRIRPAQRIAIGLIIQNAYKEVEVQRILEVIP